MLKKLGLYLLAFVIIMAATMFTLKAIDLLIDKLVYVYH